MNTTHAAGQDRAVLPPYADGVSDGVYTGRRRAPSAAGSHQAAVGAPQPPALTGLQPPTATGAVRPSGPYQTIQRGRYAERAENRPAMSRAP